MVCREFNQCRSDALGLEIDENNERRRDTRELDLQTPLCARHARTTGNCVNFPLRKILDHKWNWRGAAKSGEPYWAAEFAAAWQAYSSIQPAIVHFQAPIRPDQVIIKNMYFKKWSNIHAKLGLPRSKPKPLKSFHFAIIKARSSNRYFKARRRFRLSYLMIFFSCFAT